MIQEALYISAILGAALLASWTLTMLIRRWALAGCVVDEPNERSCHTVPTARGGGMAFVAVFTAASLTTTFLSPEAFDSPVPWRTLAVLLPLSGLGLADDLFNLSSRVRLGMHFVLAFLALALFPDTLAAATGLPGTAAFSLVLVTFTVALINFYNFMDGTDALVAGCFVLQGLFFWLVLGQDLWLPASFAVMGFLYWNLPPARIFMGDGGSTFLGGAAACAFLAAAENPFSALTGLTCTLPLTADAAYTIVRRALKGENIFSAHRQHIYQRLHITAGWSHGRIAVTYMSLTALFGLISMAGGKAALSAVAAVPLLIGAAEMTIIRNRRPTS